MASHFDVVIIGSGAGGATLAQRLAPTGKSILILERGEHLLQILPPPILFGRLRKDAGLRSLPPTQRRQGQRGPMPPYSKQSIRLAKRAGRKRGWQQVVCTP